jgi:hypothetical protein
MCFEELIFPITLPNFEAGPAELRVVEVYWVCLLPNSTVD